MEQLIEGIDIGSLLKIKNKYKKLFMQKMKMSKDVVTQAFKVLQKDIGIVLAKSLADNKTYRLGTDELKPAYWMNYKAGLKTASETVKPKRKRITVKEINKWFRGLDENKWRKTYPVDARRIAHFANFGEGCELPKSLRKKSESSNYKREQRYAQKFIEHLDELEAKHQIEERVREKIRDAINEVLTMNEGADWIILHSGPPNLAIDSYSGWFLNWRDLMEPQMEPGSSEFKATYKKLNSKDKKTVTSVLKSINS